MRGVQIRHVEKSMVLAVAALLQITVILVNSLAKGGNPSDDPGSEGLTISQPGSSATPCTKILRSIILDSLLASRGLVLETPGDSLVLSMAELAALPFCLEGPGGFTTSAGSSVAGNWAGVSLPDLLTEKGALQDHHSVTFTADDGYKMTFEGSEILDRDEGTWILATIRDGAPLPTTMGLLRTIKVGPGTPMVTGHVSVAGVCRITITGAAQEASTLSIRGRMDVEVDRQTLQSCVSCHGVTVIVDSVYSPMAYQGVPLYRMLAFSDDSLYAPHHQDSAILSYRSDLARTGYSVEVEDAGGKTLTVDSSTLDQNDDIILALYRDGKPLLEKEAPLVLVDGVSENGEESGPHPAVFPRVTLVTLHLP